ncbi:MAG: AMP-binding protein, partial [Nitrospirae bacterium]|nr:AMP-binding protein [Nitrospirota bacterium]
MPDKQPAMTLVEMLEGNAKAFPSKNAVIYRDASITYGELNAAVNRLAHTLIGLGIKKG